MNCAVRENNTNILSVSAEEADFIVNSVTKNLIALKAYKGIPILSPVEFL